MITELGVSFLLFKFKLVSPPYAASLYFSSLGGYVSFKKLTVFVTLSEVNLCGRTLRLIVIFIYILHIVYTYELI